MRARVVLGVRPVARFWTSLGMRTSVGPPPNWRAGRVIGECHPRHRAREFGRLDTVDATVPAHFDVHLILDNYATHKTALLPKS